MSVPVLSVVIPTRNPHPERLRAVLAGLCRQRFAEPWELVVVDNGSSPALDLGAFEPLPARSRVVREPQPGLLHARLCGLRATTSPVILFIDDDTVPNETALAVIAAEFAGEPRLGATGGRILPRWEQPPPQWMPAVAWALALRDNGPTALRWRYTSGATIPDWTPIGAGLALRRTALAGYEDHVARHEHDILQRSWKGQGQGGNEDKDLVCWLLRKQWAVGYEPQFVLEHIIPAGRLRLEYFEKLLPALGEMWMRTLHAHGMNRARSIPPVTLPLRKFKAWFAFKAWRGPAQRLAWLTACGTLTGLAKNHRDQPYPDAPASPSGERGRLISS